MPDCARARAPSAAIDNPCEVVSVPEAPRLNPVREPPQSARDVLNVRNRKGNDAQPGHDLNLMGWGSYFSVGLPDPLAPAPPGGCAGSPRGCGRPARSRPDRTL